MSNMSYCRFRNTLQDLRDCAKHMGDDENISAEEKQARDQMIALCREIVEEADALDDECPDCGSMLNADGDCDDCDEDEESDA